MALSKGKTSLRKSLGRIYGQGLRFTIFRVTSLDQLNIFGSLLLSAIKSPLRYPVPVAEYSSRTEVAANSIPC